MELLKRELHSGVQVRWGLAEAGMSCLVGVDYRCVIYFNIEHIPVVGNKATFSFSLWK